MSRSTLNSDVSEDKLPPRSLKTLKAIIALKQERLKELTLKGLNPVISEDELLPRLNQLILSLSSRVVLYEIDHHLEWIRTYPPDSLEGYLSYWQRVADVIPELQKRAQSLLSYLPNFLFKTIKGHVENLSADIQRLMDMHTQTVIFSSRFKNFYYEQHLAELQFGLEQGILSFGTYKHRKKTMNAKSKEIRSLLPPCQFNYKDYLSQLNKLTKKIEMSADIIDCELTNNGKSGKMVLSEKKIDAESLEVHKSKLLILSQQIEKLIEYPEKTKTMSDPVSNLCAVTFLQIATQELSELIDRFHKIQAQQFFLIKNEELSLINEYELAWMSNPDENDIRPGKIYIRKFGLSLEYAVLGADFKTIHRSFIFSDQFKKTLEFADGSMIVDQCAPYLGEIFNITSRKTHTVDNFKKKLTGEQRLQFGVSVLAESKSDLTHSLQKIADILQSRDKFSDYVLLSNIPACSMTEKEAQQQFKTVVEEFRKRVSQIIEFSMFEINQYFGKYFVQGHIISWDDDEKEKKAIQLLVTELVKRFGLRKKQEIEVERIDEEVMECFTEIQDLLDQHKANIEKYLPHSDIEKKPEEQRKASDVRFEDILPLEIYRELANERTGQLRKQIISLVKMRESLVALLRPAPSQLNRILADEWKRHEQRLKSLQSKIHSVDQEIKALPISELSDDWQRFITQVREEKSVSEKVQEKIAQFEATHQALEEKEKKLNSGILLQLDPSIANLGNLLKENKSELSYLAMRIVPERSDAAGQIAQERARLENKQQSLLQQIESNRATLTAFAKQQEEIESIKMLRNNRHELAEQIIDDVRKVKQGELDTLLDEEYELKTWVLKPNQTVEELILRLKNPAAPLRPYFIERELYYALNQDKISARTQLDAVAQAEVNNFGFLYEENHYIKYKYQRLYQHAQDLNKFIGKTPRQRRIENLKFSLTEGQIRAQWQELIKLRNEWNINIGPLFFEINQDRISALTIEGNDMKGTFTATQIKFNRKKSLLFFDILRLFSIVNEKFTPFVMDETFLKAGFAGGKKLINQALNYATLIAEIQSGMNKILKIQGDYPHSYLSKANELRDLPVIPAFQKLKSLWDDCRKHFRMAANAYDQFYIQLPVFFEQELKKYQRDMEMMGNLTARVFTHNPGLKDLLEGLRREILIYCSKTQDEFIILLQNFLTAVFKDSSLKREWKPEEKSEEEKQADDEKDQAMAKAFRNIYIKIGKVAPPNITKCDIRSYITSEQKERVESGTFIPVRSSNISHDEIKSQQQIDYNKYPLPLTGKGGGRVSRIALSAEPEVKQKPAPVQHREAAAGSAPLDVVIIFLESIKEYLEKFQDENNREVYKKLAAVILQLHKILDQSKRFKKENIKRQETCRENLRRCDPKQPESKEFTAQCAQEREQFKNSLTAIFAKSVITDPDYLLLQDIEQAAQHFREYALYLSWVDQQFSDEVAHAMKEGAITRLGQIAKIMKTVKGQKGEYSLDPDPIGGARRDPTKKELIMWNELCGFAGYLQRSPAIDGLILLLNEEKQRAALLDKELKNLPSEEKSLVVSGELAKNSQAALQEIVVRARKALRVPAEGREERAAENEPDLKGYKAEREKIIARFKPLTLEAVMACEGQWLEARKEGKGIEEIKIDLGQQSYQSQRDRLQAIVKEHFKSAEQGTLDSLYQTEQRWQRFFMECQQLRSEFEFMGEDLVKKVERIIGSIEGVTAKEKRAEEFENELRLVRNEIYNFVVELFNKYTDQFTLELKHLQGSLKNNPLMKELLDELGKIKKGESCFNSLIFFQTKLCPWFLSVCGNQYQNSSFYKKLNGSLIKSIVDVSDSAVIRKTDWENYEILRLFLSEVISGDVFKSDVQVMKSLLALDDSIGTSEKELAPGRDEDRQKFDEALMKIYKPIYGEDRTKIIQENFDILFEVTKGVHNEVLLVLKLSDFSSGIVLFGGDLWQALLRCGGKSLSEKRALIKAQIAGELLDLSKNPRLTQSLCFDFLKAAYKQFSGLDDSALFPFPNRLLSALSNIAQGLEKLRSSIERLSPKGAPSLLESRDKAIRRKQTDIEAKRISRGIKAALTEFEVVIKENQSLEAQIGAVSKLIESQFTPNFPHELKEIKAQNKKVADNKEVSSVGPQPSAAPDSLETIISTHINQQGTFPTPEKIEHLMADPLLPPLRSRKKGNEEKDLTAPEAKNKLIEEIKNIGIEASNTSPQQLQSRFEVLLRLLSSPIELIIQIYSKKELMMVEVKMEGAGSKSGVQPLYEFLKSWTLGLNDQLRKLEAPAAKINVDDKAAMAAVIETGKQLQEMLNSEESKEISLLMQTTPRWLTLKGEEIPFFQMESRIKSDKASLWSACFIALQTIDSPPSLSSQSYQPLKSQFFEPWNSKLFLQEQIKDKFGVSIYVYAYSPDPEKSGWLNPIICEKNPKGAIYLYQYNQIYCALIPASYFLKRGHEGINTVTWITPFFDQEINVQAPLPLASSSPSSPAMFGSSRSSSSSSSSSSIVFHH